MKTFVLTSIGLIVLHVAVRGQTLNAARETVTGTADTTHTLRQVVRLIDIRAFALQQVEEERMRDDFKTKSSRIVKSWKTESGAPSDFEATLSRHLSDVRATFTLGGVVIQSAPLVISSFLSLAGTLLAMHKFRRKHMRRRTLILHSAAPVSQEENIDAILAQAELIRREKSRAEGVRHADERPGRGDYAMATARKLGIAQGEVELMQQLGAAHRTNAWAKKMELFEGQESSHDTLAIAKKLGIGKGELSLAASLRRFHETQSAWEPLS